MILSFSSVAQRILFAGLLVIFSFSFVRGQVKHFQYRSYPRSKFDKRGKDLSGFRFPNYNITFYGEYLYNRSLGSGANFDLQTLVPINKNFELKCNVQASTFNYYALTTIFRPKFLLPVGELFIDVHATYRAMVVFHQHDIALGLTLGYRMHYVSFDIGWSGRALAFFEKHRVAGEGYQSEPLNIAYRLEVFARPQYNKWNISACIASYDDYLFERMWQMLFMFNGYYSLSDRWKINAGLQIKPTGMFHLNASLYASSLRFGITHIFK